MSKCFGRAAAAVIVSAVCVFGIPAALAAEPAAGPAISQASAKALLAVQQAADAKQYDVVITRVGEALKIAGRTPADTYVANQFLAIAYDQQGNKAGVLTALQGQLDSGYMQPAEKPPVANYMTRIAYELKDFAKVVEYGEPLIRSGTAEPDTHVAVGNSLLQQAKYAEATRVLKDFTLDQERSGKVPRETTLNTLRTAQDKLGDKTGVIDTFERLLVHYPKADYWEAVLFLLGRDSVMSERQKLQILRLKLATGTFKRCSEYGDLAERALSAGIAGEGLRVIQQGLADKICAEKADRDELQGMLASANRQVSDDKAGLGKLESEARASQTGELDVVVGTSRYGHGEFPAAVEALARGIGKGGLKNPADAQLLQGISQVFAGSKAAAVGTFQSIKTDDPVMQRMARLWALHAR